MDILNSALNGVKGKDGIQFGVLVNLGTNNAHYLQPYDRLKEQYVKIDTHNYLYPLGSKGSDEMVSTAEDEMRSDAKWIINLDGPFGYKTKFYLVCYTIGKNGKISNMKKIQELLF